MTNGTLRQWVECGTKERKLAPLTDETGDTHRDEISRPSRTLLESWYPEFVHQNRWCCSTKEGMFQNDINSKVLGFAFGLMAEIERNLISMRTKEALARRKQEEYFGEAERIIRNCSCCMKIRGIFWNRREVVLSTRSWHVSSGYPVLPCSASWKLKEIDGNGLNKLIDAVGLI